MQTALLYTYRVCYISGGLPLLHRPAKLILNPTVINGIIQATE